jgi:hypothetical protein
MKRTRSNIPAAGKAGIALLFAIVHHRPGLPEPGRQAAAHAMQTSKRIGWLFGVGVPLLIVALILQTITLASQDYRTVLIVALVLTLGADSCFVAAFIRGRLAARCASVVLMLPTVFVVADFMRRAPHSFS